MDMNQRFLQDAQAEPPVESLANSVHPPDLTDAADAETNALAEPAQSVSATALTTLLQQEARSRRREEFITLAWSGAYISLMLWLATRTIVDEPSYMRSIQGGFALMISMGMGLAVQLWRRSYRRKHSLTNALAQKHNVQQIGPLIQALRAQNTTVRNLAKEALIDLLPTLQASDAALLSDSERSLLLRLLSISPNEVGYRDLKELFSRSAYRREIALRVSILKALEQVGGAKELPLVERLSREHSLSFKTARMPDIIQKAAAECLPFLQERAREQRASEQLLRASSAPATPDNMLLRPATASAHFLPEQLLRPSEPNPPKPAA